MAHAFKRETLLAAFDQVAEAAIAANTRLDIAIFGGSALVLASNFRFATEDVDVAVLGEPWPAWLHQAVEHVAAENGWSDTWFNDAVSFHLSAAAQANRDLVQWRTFPRTLGQVGLTVFLPTPEYMFALKLKASRVSDFTKGTLNLLRVLHITDVEQAIAVLAKYFPNSAAHADKERFVVRYLLAQETPDHAPRYPGGDC